MSTFFWKIFVAVFYWQNFGREYKIPKFELVSFMHLKFCVRMLIKLVDDVSQWAELVEALDTNQRVFIGD